MKIATRAELTARRAQAQAWLAAEDRVILVCAGTGCIAGRSMKVYETLTALCTERGLKTRVALRDFAGFRAPFRVALLSLENLVRRPRSLT